MPLLACVHLFHHESHTSCSTRVHCEEAWCHIAPIMLLAFLFNYTSFQSQSPTWLPIALCPMCALLLTQPSYLMLHAIWRAWPSFRVRPHRICTSNYPSPRKVTPHKSNINTYKYGDTVSLLDRMERQQTTCTIATLSALAIIKECPAWVKIGRNFSSPVVEGCIS